MARYFWCALGVLQLLAMAALAAPPTSGGDRNGEGRRPPPLPIPQFKKVTSDHPSFQDSIGGMVVSDPYASDFPWVQTGTDTTETEVQLLSDFVHSQGRFASNAQVADKSELFIRLNRYNMGDSRVTALLIEAHKLGMNVQFMTDLSRTAKNIQYDSKGRFKEFYRLKAEDFLPSSKGVAIAQMLNAGAEFADPSTGKLNPTFGIYGIMYEERAGVENPLQHMKGLLVGRKVKGEVADIWGTDGTGNMVPHAADGSVGTGTRSNRLIIEHDREYLLNNYNHFEVMRQTYAAGGETKDIPLAQVPPLEEHFANGDMRRVMFTDGQYNPHDMTALTLLRSVIEDQVKVESITKYNPGLAALVKRQLESGEIPRKNVKITKVKIKEFLLTNRSIFGALQLAMEANPNLVLEGSFDQEFAGLETQGLVAPMFGFVGMREFGGNMRGWSPRLVARNHLHIYQRMIDGAKETNRAESWLTHYLLHDKTIMFWVEEPTGETKVHIFTKSFNMSSHVDNAEELDEIVVSPDSPVAKAFEESIDKPIAGEPQWYIPGFNAIVRDAIGRLTGHTDTEITLEELRTIMRAYHDGDFSTVGNTLEKIALRESTLDNHREMTAERVHGRLDAFVGFLRWQKEQDGALYQEHRFDFLDQRFAGFAALIANQDPLDQRERTEVMRDPFQARQAINELLWTHDIEKNQQLRLNRVTFVWEQVLKLGTLPAQPRKVDRAKRSGAEPAIAGAQVAPPKPQSAGPAPVSQEERERPRALSLGSRNRSCGSGFGSLAAARR